MDKLPDRRPGDESEREVDERRKADRLAAAESYRSRPRKNLCDDCVADCEDSGGGGHIVMLVCQLYEREDDPCDRCTRTSPDRCGDCPDNPLRDTWPGLFGGSAPDGGV